MIEAIRKQQGFALAELLIAMTIMGIIASVATPHFFDSAKSARAAACTGTRDAIRKAALIYLEKIQAPFGSPLPSLEQITETGILTSVPECPAKGNYIWIDEGIPEDRAPYIGCSVHYWPSLSPPEEEQETDPLFSSAFDDLSGLAQGNGSWIVENGNLVPVGGKKNARTSNMITIGNSSFNDFSLDLTATNTGGSGYNLFYRGTLSAKGEKFNSGYVLTYDPARKKFVVKPIENGKFKKDIASYKLPKGFPTRNQPHDISISTSGSNHTVSINGQAVMNFTDSRYTSGLSGISSGKTSGTKGNSFQNLEVREPGS